MAKSASAGSGKTTALVFRYITLLLKGAKPSEIVALTFTVKAANNMKERIVTALREIKEYPFLEELSLECDMSADELVKHASEISRDISISQMRISTLDSFFASILSKFCFYANVPYGFETLESSELGWLRRKFLGALDRDQKIALASYLAGHKKKLGYFFELFELFDEKNIEPDKLFEVKSLDADGLESQISSLVSNITAELSSAREINLFAYKKIEELSSKAIFAFDSMNEHGWLKNKQFSSGATESFNALKNLIKIHFQQKEQEYIKVVTTLYKSYQEAKYVWMNRRGKLTFSDVSGSVYKLLCSDGSIDTDFLYFRLDSRINHILIDEFQDTSLLQYEILKPLIDEVASGVGQSEFASFFFVGDVKQSIYRFRGGFSQLFDFVANALSPNGLKVEKLNTNYRSDKAIVEFANEQFLGVIDSYEPQASSERAGIGYVEVSECTSNSSGEMELDGVVLGVLEKIEQLMVLGAGEDDIAVLTPTNADSVAVVNAIGEHTNHKATQEVSSKLVTQTEPMAIINYLKYCFYGEAIYKEIFLALANLPQFVAVEKIFMNVAPIDAVCRCIEMFGLCSKEAMKLSFLASEYSDMYDFIMNIEKNSAKTIEDSSGGIKVLTVHKSKGLEFKYVICMDRIASKGQGDDDMLLEFDGLDIRRAYFRFSNRQKFDEEYNRAWELEKEQARRDRLNMLYVAFTRAEHAMFIIKKAPNVKKDGSLGAYTGLFDLERLVVCSHGKLEVHSAQAYKNELKEPAVFELKYHGTQKVDEKQEEPKNIDEEAKYFGLAMHLALEMVDFVDIDSSMDEALRFAISRAPISIDAQKLRQAVSAIVLHEPFLSSLRGKEIFKECSFVHDSRVKRMDMIAIGANSAVVVDYKSSTFPRPEHYTQVEQYARAVRDICGVEPQTMILTGSQGKLF